MPGSHPNAVPDGAVRLFQGDEVGFNLGDGMGSARSVESQISAALRGTTFALILRASILDLLRKGYELK
jgi:hypothetical protein